MPPMDAEAPAANPLQAAAALLRQGRLKEARQSYRAILAQHPGLFAGWYGYGALVASLGLVSEARESFERALALRPDDPAVLNQLAHVLHESGDHDEATAMLERVVALQPDWAQARSSLLLFQQYRPGLTPAQLLEAARAWGNWAEALAGGPRARPPLRPLRPGGGPLRVGYVSGDFRTHPGGLFLAPVLAHHDPARVIPFAYDNAPKQDPLARDLRQAVARAGGQWREIDGLSDADAAAQIAADGIDLLVDLAGHTARGRLTLFAHRPAPLQMAWLGYFGTTGLRDIDMLITDPFHSPPGSEAQFSETLLRMPQNRFCFRPLLDQPPREGSAFRRNGHVTFGCFNNPAKLNETVLAAWAAILQRLPQARLLLKWQTYGDERFRQRILAMLQQHGVAPDRVECRSASPYPKLLRQYDDMDIALDPFPFCGGQSSVEALWMGVPIVSLKGERMASRQSYSFLSAIGLGDLAADDLQGYIDTAVALAGDSERLAALQLGLRHRMAQSPLCDAAQFTRDLETLYHEAWRRLRDRQDTEEGQA